MDKKFSKIELLAPAGNMEKMKTALVFGADAVYAGIPDFSLRVRINDFDLEKIKEATEYCHKIGKKIYITVNIFAHNRHLEKLPVYIKKLKKIKVDALIISDPGVIEIVKEIWPEVEIHLSTQANCTNWQAAKFWQAQGVKRIILGRETTLPEIKMIHKKCPDLELEYFVHGAMCMAYSGRCFLSKYYADRSANLGDCVQPCRWKGDVRSEKLEVRNEKGDEFEIVEEEHGSYILNSKDLCLVKYLKELQEAGISSFKIEGRAKSVYYQAVVAGIYSRAIELLGIKNKKNQIVEMEYLQKELETKLVHRGYTTGFLLGDKADQNLDNSHEKSEWEFCGVVVSKKLEVRSKKFKARSEKVLIKVHNSIRVGDEIEIVKPKYDIIKLKVERLWDAKTGAEIAEAHGGQGALVWLELDEMVVEFSVIRRKISKL
ncbi:MAG: Peptidase U32 [Candidatus Falkowbacteria bacterium GW2011_GWC2_38_22]|uniref:Peptidase U32 n=1 Tax=Candidatus Falkowbacteria bacterium GW2011_GWE1_38_31 TaxID=1618638 RepID=A0A0G0JS07_9BACT|nr:MAG: Peptidase U32 [Candidatus Falkowbacteria bacterium GW2011_GWF2_38_1205]KKQ61538.1 MAG: Peptidase U32 [Candidatus Falkowbacteria bacterium GW2011_GWC2_38_22]KKQ63569.1 MAG: Peptidase U32 [Candidatus Falkowbacteria bacterium GW2011_GWF1_38_22]KKQ65721.1 MAG: Peptidase U32 [Candidatus Falkowbacteria bacterium GW2011_GWE2_38_254]KKQ70338.1 MAG: Peptidase U32 [Candidatus Falkowbacteria bacterium GW2011_GWE1_38_31]KKQ72843.1 MAG: Peptidase U32 [Candidatus Falkowbacteria bacterium GW2011_GWD2